MVMGQGWKKKVKKRLKVVTPFLFYGNSDIAQLLNGTKYNNVTEIVTNVFIFNREPSSHTKKKTQNK